MGRFLMLLVLISSAWAASDLDKRTAALAEELRCLVCQNQTLAESNAPLAVDLRNQMREQLSKGASEREVREFMVARYGDFVLYKPPFHATTALLWLGPPLLIASGIGIFFVVVRRRRQSEPPGELPARRRKELEALLQDKQG